MLSVLQYLLISVAIFEVNFALTSTENFKEMQILLANVNGMYCYCHVKSLQTNQSILIRQLNELAERKVNL